MYKQILFFLFQLGFLSLYAQFGPQQIISSDAENVYQVLPADVDNDGFIDVMSLLRNPYKIVWFRNLDGQGNFGPEILINDNSALYNTFEFVDLDSDGDNDILYEVNNPHKVAWLENLDGMGQFGSEQVVLENQPEFIIGIKSADLDGDNDLDLIVRYGDTFHDKLVWLENIDGQGNFANEVTLFEEVGYTINFPIIIDLDSDNDLDIVTAYEYFQGPAKIIRFENDGNGFFGEEIEIHQFDFFSDWTSVYRLAYADINTDGIPDLAVTTQHDDFGPTYIWFQHLGNGEFGDSYGLTNSGVSFTHYQFHDFDNDGDNDVLSSRRNGADRIFWVENTDGLGTFSVDRTITTEVDFTTSIKAVDINGDGLLDVISGSSGDNKVAWYENTGILGVIEENESKFKIYPNPVTDVLYVHSQVPITQLTVYDILGKSILEKQGDTGQINVSNLPSGLLFVKLESLDGFAIKKIVKQ